MPFAQITSGLQHGKHRVHISGIEWSYRSFQAFDVRAHCVTLSGHPTKYPRQPLALSVELPGVLSVMQPGTFRRRIEGHR